MVVISASVCEPVLYHRRSRVNNNVDARSRLCHNVAMSYTAPMTKEPALGIRLEADEKAALETAAKADQRPLSAMGRKIIADWLRANGYLGEAHNIGPKSPGDV